MRFKKRVIWLLLCLVSLRIDYFCYASTFINYKKEFLSSTLKSSTLKSSIHSVAPSRAFHPNPRVSVLSSDNTRKLASQYVGDETDQDEVELSTSKLMSNADSEVDAPKVASTVKSVDYISQSNHQAGVHPLFFWNPVRGAGGYELEVSISNEFERPVFKIRVRENYYYWEPENLGVYYWRVKAIDMEGQAGSNSSIGMLIVKLSGPKISNEVQNYELADETKTNTKKSFGFIIPNIDFFSTLIQSQDIANNAQARIASRSNYGLSLNLVQHWNDSINTSFYFGRRVQEFFQPSTTLLLSGSTILYSFGGGIAWQATSKLGLGANVSLEQGNFLKGVSLTQITFDNSYVPVAKINARYEAINVGSFKFGISGGPSVYFPVATTSFQSYLNLGYDFKLYVLEALANNWILNLGLTTKYINENTSLVIQQQQDYGVELGISIPLAGSNNKRKK